MTTSQNQEKEAIEHVVQRAREGCADAFDLLVDAYSSRVYGFVFRLVGHRDEAEEITQDVFVRLVRTIMNYQDCGKFEAWLFRIAANRVRDYVRRQVRRPAIRSLTVDSEHESAPELLVDKQSKAPAERLQEHDDHDRLQRALAQLSDSEREVVLLRHYSQLSFQAIAEIMNTPLGTALARGHRGVAKLRELMEE